MSWSEFFAMGGKGFYVWGSYLVAAAVIAIEIVAVRARCRRALAETQEESPDETPS